jgi:hypothetical protein
MTQGENPSTGQEGRRENNRRHATDWTAANDSAY